LDERKKREHLYNIFPPALKLKVSFSCKTSFFQNKRGNAWHFQAWNIGRYGQVQHAADVLKLRLDPLRIQTMPPFYATALGTWYNMAPVINPKNSSSEALRGFPLWNSNVLTPKFLEIPLYLIIPGKP
jgi:hypothetical protein